MQLFTLRSSKTEVFETCFYDILTTRYDHPKYVKHVSGRIYLFFTLFGYWVWGGGASKGCVHNLLLQVFSLGSSKIEVFEICFFDTTTSSSSGLVADAPSAASPSESTLPPRWQHGRASTEET